MLCRTPLNPMLVRALESTAQWWLVRQTVRNALGAAVVRAAELAAREIQDLIAAEQEFREEMDDIDREYGI